MPWSPQQIATVRNASFTPARFGYVREDAERLRTRALVAMENGSHLPDLDTMALRRRASGGVRMSQVEGLRTTLKVWTATTPIEDPEDLHRRQLAGELAAFEDRPTQWSPEQIDLVRQKTFPLVGRTSVAYEEKDVDDYLDSVVAAMRLNVELPDPKHARFDSAGLRRGYDPRAVDEFLDLIGRMRPEG